MQSIPFNSLRGHAWGRKQKSLNVHTGLAVDPILTARIGSDRSWVPTGNPWEKSETPSSSLTSSIHLVLPPSLSTTHILSFSFPTPHHPYYPHPLIPTQMHHPFFLASIILSFRLYNRGGGDGTPKTSSTQPLPFSNHTERSLILYG